MHPTHMSTERLRPSFWGLAIALFFLVSCNSTPTVDQAQPGSAPGARNADDLVVVDCALPPQVRKLGKMTYLSPRRPIRTTAQMCEIRGGEYVAFDRANLATALNVWLPMAKQGDPGAQTHVGEIFQKGVGSAPPRYEMAREWFQKAADQGFTRAQINLGYLYEQGLGVSKDTVVAMNWYRKASGLENELVVGHSDLTAAERAELKQLRSEVQVLKEEGQLLRQQLDQKQKELNQRRQELQRRSDRLQQQNEALELARQDLKQATGASKGKSTTDRKFLAEIRKRESELKAERVQIAALKKEISDRQQEAAAFQAKLEQVQKDGQVYAQQTQAQLEKLQRQVAAGQSQIGNLQGQLATNTDRLKKQQSDLALRQQRMVDQRKQLEIAQASLKKQKGSQVQSSQDAINRLEARIQQQQADLEKREQEMAQLQSQIKSRVTESESFKEKIAALEARFEKLPAPVIEVRDPKPMVTRGIRVAPVEVGLKTREINGRVWAPAGLQALKVNGRTVEANAEGEFTVSVALRDAKGTRVQIVAIDPRGRQSDVDFQLTPDESVTSKSHKPLPKYDFGSYHALVIGNIDYQRLPKLDTAVNDAQTLSNVLRDQYQFEVRTLINATRYDILAALNRYRKELTDKDNFLLFFAGHGEMVAQNKRGYWLPVDADPDSDVNWLPNYQITDILNIMSAKQVLVIADACYSGALTRSTMARLEAGRSDTAQADWYKTLSQKRSRRVLSSGELKPVLDSDGGNHSIFARALLHVLEKNNGVIEGVQLYQQVAAEVAQRSKAMGLQQVPQYAGLIHAGHESGDFLFVPKSM